MKTSCMTLLTIVLFASISTAIADETAQPKYITLDTPQSTQTGDKIEVLEVFWYGCPHCYAFEPFLKKWLNSKPDNVEFRLMPGILNRAWVAHARAYYTAEKLGILDKIHHQLFDAIHKDNRYIFDEDSIKAFFIEQGIDADQFSKVYDSQEIDNKLRQAFQEQVNAKIGGVPSIIINGKYLTSPSMADGYENLEQVMNSLIAKESRGR